MIIAFYSYYLNHHQIPLAEEFLRMTDVEYYFVAIEPVPEFRKKIGYKEYKDATYLIDTTNSPENETKALKLAIEADVAVFITDGMAKYEIPRLRLGKLTFEVSERWFKKGIINLFSPRLIKHQLMYYKYGRKVGVKMLACSAYAPNDYYFMRSFKNQCYKWGYFTKVEDFDLEASLDVSRRGRATILWCARFLSWKHPELPILLAKRLKEDGYIFHLDMIGSGEKYPETVELAKSLEVEDVVSFLGNMSNDEVLLQMRQHQILLFTSDRNEGWGAVLNEAMSNGCAVICSNEIGSVPFLIKHGENGLIFKSKDINSLYDNTIMLLSNPELCKQIGITAYYDIQRDWSPRSAAKRFVDLVRTIQDGNDAFFTQGPCSKALPVSNKR